MRAAVLRITHGAGASVLAFLAFNLLVNAAEKVPFELSDLGLEVGLSSAEISPDGRSVVLVTSRPDYGENRFDTQLVLVDTEGGTPRPLTFSRKQVRDPQWSPAGDRIAFLAADEKGVSQVFVLPLSGGEAQAWTASPKEVKSFSWRPDGRDLAYAAPDKPEEKTGEEKHNRSFRVGKDVYFAESETLPTHIWLANGGPEQPRKLTRGPGGIQNYISRRSFDWSPDGKRIVYLSQELPHSGEVFRCTVQIVDVETEAARTLLSEEAWYEEPRFSPDGTWIGLGKPRGDAPGFDTSSFYAVPAEGGTLRDVGSAIDRDLRGGWTPDGLSVLLTGPDGTKVSLWQQPLEGAVRRIDLGEVLPDSIPSVSRQGSLAFIGKKVDQPPEVYFMRSTETAPQQLTEFNQALADRKMGRVETVGWRADGFDQNGVLNYPPDFDAQKKYPLVLLIHGGPMGTSTEAFALVRQILAAQGWLIFSPNYRGSNNQGSQFQRAVVNDAGEGPGRDVMAGIEAVKAKGIVDESRIAVSGWSYGGYMTTWLTAHYPGWAAAVAGAAVTDWFDWYNLADLNNWAGFGLGGSPWLNDNMDNYWRQSPIAYASQIRTPMLILSNTLDQRVTVTQSFKLFYALRDNRVPVEFVAYPVPGHFPGDPVHQKDVWRRWIDWIETHFQAQ